MKKIAVLLLLSIFVFSCGNNSSSGRMGGAANTSRENTLIVGTSGVFPPFSYVVNGENLGFDIAFAKLIAENANKTLKIEIIEFDKLIDNLQNGNIDMIAAAMTITDERKQIIDFSDSYYKTAQAIVIRESDKNSFSEIIRREELGSQKRLAAERGATGAEIAKSIAGENGIHEGSSDEMIQELIDGIVDAVIIDDTVANASILKYDGVMIYSSIMFEAEHYGLAVRKGNTALLDIINKTINDLVVSGNYNQLVEHHINNYSAQ